ncbi:MAG TPA: nucleoside hydrolase, partial [Acidobacteriaceae bacterium]
LQTLLVLIQSPQVEVLGITVVSGDQWRDEELAHTQRLLEIIGRTDIPEMIGAAFPLLRTRQEARQWQEQFGKVSYSGAWDDRWWHEPFVVPPLPEGQPTTKPSEEDAAHFLVRMVRKYPNEITIYGGGPMTNLALAQSIDPKFAELAQELVFMGGSLYPHSSDPEFANNPRREFNFWFDPEATHITLRAHWARIDLTTVDISVKTAFTKAMLDQIAGSSTPAAKYLATYTNGFSYCWDELAAAAWLDPAIITKEKELYIDVNLNRGPSYGDTLSWTAENKPALDLQPVHVQTDLDLPRFNAFFIDLMKAPPQTPSK